jgi:hypothetical protein
MNVLEGKRVIVNATTIYQFHTAGGALGFFRALSAGHGLDQAKDRWRPRVIWATLPALGATLK